MDIKAKKRKKKMNQVTLNNNPGEKPNKQYTPYEYLNYTVKVNNSKESYLNSLKQLGIDYTQNLNSKPYIDILSDTKNLIQNSYSIKYVGIIDGNMGILT